MMLSTLIDFDIWPNPENLAVIIIFVRKNNGQKLNSFTQFLQIIITTVAKHLTMTDLLPKIKERSVVHHQFCPFRLQKQRYILP